MAGIIITRALFTPGNEALKTAWFSVSRQGIYDGVVISWRLLLIIFSSLLFISSTRASEIKTAVQWFLKPIPFVPEKTGGNDDESDCSVYSDDFESNQRDFGRSKGKGCGEPEKSGISIFHTHPSGDPQNL